MEWLDVADVLFWAAAFLGWLCVSLVEIVKGKDARPSLALMVLCLLMLRGIS